MYKLMMDSTIYEKNEQISTEEENGKGKWLVPNGLGWDCEMY